MNKATVLLVDDEPEILSLFGDALQANGFSVRKATDFPSSFEALHNGQFGLLILDKVSGYRQILDRFRALMPESPVLLISGATNDEDDLALMAGKLDRVVQKPIGIVALLAHVYGCLATDGAAKP
jgi:DNA-binding response OmpR family regulator